MMPKLLPVMVRLAAEAARGDLGAMRRRLMRSLAMMIVMLILATVALTLGAAALAIVLADWIGLVPASLSVAAVATISALVLALSLSLSTKRARTLGTGLPALSDVRLPPVSPLAVVGGALAVGLLLGHRRR